MKTLTEAVAGTQIQIEMVDPAEAQATDDTLAAMYERAKLLALSSASRSIPIGVLLSPRDLAVWRWRYPTVYRWPDPGPKQPAALGRQLVLNWERLLWPVPAHVCGLIQHCFERIGASQGFDALEIWTPELRQAPRLGPSPILVGWIDQRAYLLARWAEALEPFGEIRTQAESRRGRAALRLRDRYMFWEDTAARAVLNYVSVVMVPLLLMLLGARFWVALFLAGVAYGSLVAFLLGNAPWRWRMRRVAAWAGWVLPEAPSAP